MNLIETKNSAKKSNSIYHIIQTKFTINTKTPAIKYLNTNNVKAKLSSPPPPRINDRVTLHKRSDKVKAQRCIIDVYKTIS